MNRPHNSFSFGNGPERKTPACKAGAFRRNTVRNSTNTTTANGMEHQGTSADNSAVTPSRRAETQHRSMMNRAKRVGMFSERMEITPEFAGVILERYAPPGTNRALRMRHVEALAAQMTAGAWNDHTHQGVAFRSDGVLADGQHRLRACVLSGVPFTVPVTYGQPADVFLVLDDGARRSPADVLQAGGVIITDKNVVAAVARQLLGLTSVFGGKSEVLEFTKDHTEALSAAAKSARSITNRIAQRVTPTPIATALFLIARTAQPAHVNEFVQKLGDGTDLSAGSPILALRNALINKSIAHVYRHYADANHVVAASVVMAWNLWRANRKCVSSKPLLIGKDDAFPTVRA